MKKSTHYSLTKQQWLTLFRSKYPEWDVGTVKSEVQYDNRVKIFQTHFPTLKYEETHYTHGNGYWGIITGTEQNINWFLLQL